MTSSSSIGPVSHRIGTGHRCAKNVTASAIFVTHLDAPEGSRQPIGASHLPLFSAISNRYTKLLEFFVTCTKQTVAARSNRYKIRPSPHRSLSSPSRLAPIGPAFLRARVREERKATGRRFLIHCPELDIELSRTKQRVGPVSNRQFFALLKLPGQSANLLQGLV